MQNMVSNYMVKAAVCTELGALLTKKKYCNSALCGRN
uniref:Uncharacterized protein n=1 Tax=Arundo donax TaxID=35708 RepID=A0A0A9H953_ARUDO